MLLEQDGVNILFDPFLPLNKKVFYPPIAELSKADGIFITHGHFDHISATSDVLKQSDNPIMVYCTKNTQDILVSKGVSDSQISCVAPGEAVELGSLNVQVLKSKHINYDTGMILRTIFNPRILYYWHNFKQIINANENRDKDTETVMYEINVQNKRVLLMGSLNLDDDIEYTPGADLLILPLQGRMDINRYTMPIIDRLKPSKILLFHFDNTFPPFSYNVNAKRFLACMSKEYPDIPVICTPASAEWIEL